jgi:hypothetical protein
VANVLIITKGTLANAERVFWVRSSSFEEGEYVFSLAPNTCNMIQDGMAMEGQWF